MRRGVYFKAMSVIQRESGSLRAYPRRRWGVLLLLCLLAAGPVDAIDEACEQTDLRGANLSGLDCAGLDLPGADLSPAEGPPEVRTDIRGTDFSQAKLSQANMTKVEGGCTQEASCTLFDQAELDSSIWTEASLADVSFFGASLNSADFTNADLAGADLAESDLFDAKLSTAFMTGVHATDLVQCPAELPADWSCIFWNLVGPGADLSGVDLSEADLSGQNFMGVDLGDTVFEGANFTLAYLDGATAICAPEACPANFNEARMEFASLQAG